MSSSEAPHIDCDDTYWESVARTSWGAYTTEIEERALLKAHQLAGEPSTGLEIGAEGGRWSRRLTDMGWSMICTDINEDSVATCKKRIPTADCIHVSPDDTRIPCESERIGLLLCIEVGPVMQADWFVGEASRVLRDRGLVVGVFWNLWSLRGLFVHVKSLLGASHGLDWYRLPYAPWRRKLLDSGYSILHEEGFCWFPFSRNSNSTLVPHVVRLEQGLGLRRLASISPWVVFIARKMPEVSSR